MTRDPNGALRVSVPAKPEFVQVLRIVVRSVASRADFSYDVVYELGLAVDEACGQLLALKPTPTFFVVEIIVSSASIEVGVFADSGQEPWPPDGVEGTLAWKILDGLTDQTRYETGDDGTGLRFTKRVPTGGEE